MNWKFWQTKPKKTIFTIEIQDNKDLIITADWAKPESSSEEELANDLAATIILVTNGHLNELFFGALASAGKVNDSSRVASMATKLVVELGDNYAKKDLDSVVVPKSHQVFSKPIHFIGGDDDNDQDYS